MSYVLYGGSPTRALLVEMVLAEGGIDYELRRVDIAAGEHRGEAFLAVNPAGWVPALVTPEGEALYETPAINLYLGERHQLTELVPAPGDPVRGAFLSGLFYLSGELEPAMKRCFYPHRYAPRPEDAPWVEARAEDDALARLGVIDGRLARGGPYHLGDRFSLVDLTMTYWAKHFDDRCHLEPFPAVRRCIELTTARPALAGKFAELAAMYDE